MWDPPRPGIELESPVLQADSLPMGHQGSLLFLSPLPFFLPSPSLFLSWYTFLCLSVPFLNFCFSFNFQKKCTCACQCVSVCVYNHILFLLHDSKIFFFSFIVKHLLSVCLILIFLCTWCFLFTQDSVTVLHFLFRVGFKVYICVSLF